MTFPAALLRAQEKTAPNAQQSTVQGMWSYGNMRRSVQEKTEGAKDQTPGLLSRVGIQQNLNGQLPLDVTFTNSTGEQVKLGEYFGKRPAILALVYYRCPMLCSEELEGLTSALKMVNFVPGKDFDIVVVSFDPTEGPALAAERKAHYLKLYGHPETADGWHFLTGTQPNIDALTQAVGFHYVKLKVPGTNLTQYAHASSIQIVTPEGKLAQYYMGVEYSPKDMLLGLDEASSNKIGSPVDNILTYCYHYDPTTNTHSLVVARVVQLGALLTLVVLGGFMAMMLRRDFRQAHQAETEKKVNG
ncbi:MAG TPA: SCO family protein [Terracidiphilus sp.]|nr:SCO family protein [Terracidiphilus sp.]